MGGDRPAVPTEIKREILIESAHRCAACGDPTPLEIAHIIPWHKSKDHNAENLICLCANCHARADKEKWGEKALREYKRSPWVKRYKSDSLPERMSKIEMTIEMELPNFDEKNQRWLQHAVAAFLDIAPDAVRITSAVETSSITVTMELPEDDAEKLVTTYNQDHSELSVYLHPLILLDLHRVETEPEQKKSVLDLLQRTEEYTVGSVGSPSNTTEIVIDILQASETQRILGQLVCLVVPQDDRQLVVIGQISMVETKNRWHEDMTFRGIIKRRGHLPNLSDTADVRTATISVQACFAVGQGKEGIEEITEGTLGVSPSTGLPIYRVRDEVLDALLRRYVNQIIYLGHVYGADVKMPLWLKHFNEGDGGAGEAYHIGVFGKTGSGKSGLAAYMFLGYARHHNMGIIFIDPQGQFSSGRRLPFALHETLRRMGRTVEIYRLSRDVRLPHNNVPLFCNLLNRTKFYRNIGIGGKNIEGAKSEFRSKINRVLHNQKARLDNPPADLLREVLQSLVDDAQAIQRIYLTKDPQKRLINTINGKLGDETEFRDLLDHYWQPMLDLFMATDSKANRRTSLNAIIDSVIGSSGAVNRPIIFIDISAEGTSFEEDDEVKAMFLNQITLALKWQGQKAFRQGTLLNCLVALDEAHLFAKASTAYSSDEMASLSKSFVDAVRTTRKYGLGYMFITQTLASLHSEILQQLRLNAYGFGLTMGGEFRKLEELVGDRQALTLYRSFVDPQSSQQFPFMFTGPASPLSFTGAPLFVQAFTSFNDFLDSNTWMPAQAQTVFHASSGQTRPVTPPPHRREQL